MKQSFSSVLKTVFSLGMLCFLTGILSAATPGHQIKPDDLIRQESVLYRSEGRALQNNGKLLDALNAYRKAVVVNPGYAEAYNDMGVVLESLGKPDDAIATYRKALQNDPLLGGAHTNLALLYEKKGDSNKAAQHWAARVNIGPAEDPWVIQARAKLQKQHGGVPSVAIGSATGPRRDAQIELAYEAGLVHLRAHEWEDAAAEFQRVLELDPTHSKALRRLRKANAWIDKEKRRRPTRREVTPYKEKVQEADAVSWGGDSLKVVTGGPNYTVAEPGLGYTWGKPNQTADSPDVPKTPNQVVLSPGIQSSSAVSMMKSGPAHSITQSSVTVAVDAREKAQAEALAAAFARDHKKTESVVSATVSSPVVVKTPKIKTEQINDAASAVNTESEAQSLYRDGVTAMRERNFQQAIGIFEQVLSLDPNHRRAQLALKRAQAAAAK